ncbi:MAG: DUF2079 domain-containing protein [Bacteriovoracaceae bacterium]
MRNIKKDFQTLFTIGSLTLLIPFFGYFFQIESLFSVRTFQFSFVFFLLIFSLRNKAFFKTYFKSHYLQSSSKLREYLFSRTNLLLVIMTLLYVLQGVSNFYGLRILSADYSLFDLMLKNYWENGTWHTEACDCNHFGYHTNYIFYILTWVHWVFKSPLFMNILQGIVIMTGIFPLKSLMRSFKIPPVESFLFCLLYLNYVQFSIILKYNFHVEIFYIPFFLWLFSDIVKGKIPLIPVLLCLSVREDAGLYTTATLIAGALFYNLNKAFVAGASMVSLGVFYTSFEFILPYFRGEDGDAMAIPARDYKYGKSIKEVAINMLSNPFAPMKDIFMGHWWKFVAKFAFLPALSKTFFIAVFPLLLLFCTVSFDYMRMFALYYSASLIPFLLFGMLESFSRIKLRPSLKFSIVCFIFILNSLVGSGYPRYAKRSPQYDEYQKILSQYEGKTLCLQSNLIPVTAYKFRFKEFSKCHKHEFDVMILNRALHWHPYEVPEHFENQIKAVLESKNSDYQKSKKRNFEIWTKMK